MTHIRFANPNAAMVACVASIISTWRKGGMSDDEAYRAIVAYAVDAERESTEDEPTDPPPKP